MLTTAVTVEVSEDWAAAASGVAGSLRENGTAVHVFRSVVDSSV